ncbi:aspartate kinase [Lentzea californiensis]|uniref:aspartate kinase n=1 Tax=Lentzea californiensis TaxID=438851 RepID=UPI002165810A|nr:aspartate kinase [Lentzea californiensis]MCR3750111.1 aspartate kinase [Lentzea californiensis]
MNLVVQKYGGTSLCDANKIRHAAQRIAAEDRYVVAVVSAMGSTTDTMLNLAHDITDSPHARELDVLLSTGERASAAALALALHELGVPARSFSGRDGGILTDGVHGSASIVSVDAVRIRECVHSGIVPVVTGFQGVATDTGELTTLSRGGSDTTAVALAAALGAEVCEIFTDVEGVFTADPRHVAEARKVDHLSYGDMAELAAHGAAVLAHPSVEYARNHRVALHVRPSATHAAGTWVTGSHPIPPDGERFTAVGIAHQTGRLCGQLDGVDPVALTAITAALADPVLSAEIVDDATAGSASAARPLRFIAPAANRHEAERVLADLHAAGAFTRRHWSGPMGKVSLVGRGLPAHHNEVRNLVVDTLKTHRTSVQDMTVHSRRISITCAEHDVFNVATQLHRTFLPPAPAQTTGPAQETAQPRRSPDGATWNENAAAPRPALDAELPRLRDRLATQRDSR